MRLTGGKQRADDAHTYGCLMITTEQIVFSSQCDGADCVFRQIVVDAYSALIQIAHHVVPAGIGIGD